jgi:hypothetical protein
MSDEFESVRTLVRALDVSTLSAPDVDLAIRGGRRRRRIAAADRGIAAGVALALVLGGVAWVVGSRPASLSPNGPLPDNTSAGPKPSPSVHRSPLVTGRVGQAVDVGSTGLRLRLSAKGYCEESAPGANVPLGPCRTANDPNGMGDSSGGWGHVEVVTGITMKEAVSVTVVRTDGHTYTGTLVQVPGANWMAYYVVMPWSPGSVVDAAHPTPSNDIVNVNVTIDTGSGLISTAP